MVSLLEERSLVESVGERLAGVDDLVGTLYGWIRDFLYLGPTSITTSEADEDDEGSKKKKKKKQKESFSSSTSAALMRPRSSGFVVVTGEPGTGKSVLVESITKALKFRWAKMSGSGVHKAMEGAAETYLLNFFEAIITQNIEDQKKLNCSSCAALVTIEDLDILLPKGGSLVERKVSSQFLQAMDKIQHLNDTRVTNVMLIGVTSRLHAIDTTFLRPYRFEKVLKIPIPSPATRFKILRKYMADTTLSEADLLQVSERTHGFVGSDLENLSRESRMIALARNCELPTVLFSDLESALGTVRPSILQDALGSSVRNKLRAQSGFGEGVSAFSDLAGVDAIVEELYFSLMLPVKNKNLIQRFGVSAPRGMLLYGPSGTGKTTLALCAARATGLNLIVIQGPELLSKVVGETERSISDLFRSSRAAAPCIILIDQIDVITPKRKSLDGGSNSAQDRMLSCLLTEMDGILGGTDEMVVVIGTTSHKDEMDEAILRPGRLDQHFHLDLPDLESRKSILKKKLGVIPLDSSLKESETFLDDLATRTEGFSGADIENLCREAVLETLRHDITSPIVSQCHFESALAKRQIN